MERKRRRLWTWLISAAAVLILLAAAFSLGFRFLVEAVPGYRGTLEARVAAVLGRPVKVGSMALVWRGLAPELSLRDIAVLDARNRAELLSVARVDMGTSLGRLIAGSTMPGWIEIGGVRAEADIDLDGRVTIRGIDVKDSGGESPLKRLEAVDRIRVRDAQLVLRDARLGPRARLQPLVTTLDTAELRHASSRYRLTATATPPREIAARAEVGFDLEGDPAVLATWAGSAEARLDGLRGWPWLGANGPEGARLRLDGADAQLHATVLSGRMTDARLTAQAAVIEVHGPGLGTGPEATRLTGLSLSARARPRTPDDDAADEAPDKAPSKATETGWHIDIEHLRLSGRRGAWPEQQAQLDLGPGRALDLRLGLLRIDDLIPFAALMHPLPAIAQHAYGDLVDAHLVRPATSDGEPATFTLDAGLREVGLHAADPDALALSGLDAQLHVDGHGGALTLDGASPRLSAPNLFTAPLSPKIDKGSVQWTRDAAGLRLRVPAFAAAIDGAEARGQLEAQIPDDAQSPPRMKLVADLRSVDAARLKPLMPLTWGEHTREWLGRAIVRGRVPRGRLAIDGPLVPRNEQHPDGTPWTLELDVADAALAFHPEWPAATPLNAHLSFRDHGLHITGGRGVIDGVPAHAVTADIDDFHDSPLELHVEADADAAAGYRLLRDSPLRVKLASLLERTEASGPVALVLDLQIPLHEPHPDVRAEGTVRLGEESEGARLAVRGLAQPVEDIRGALHFSRNVRAEHIEGRVFGTPLSVAIAPEPAPDGSRVDTLRAEFNADPQQPGGPMETYVPAWLRAGLSGEAHFALHLPFAGPDSGRVTIASDLRGIRSTLPAPLGKAADDGLPLAVRIAAQKILVGVGDDALRVALRTASDDDGQAHTRGVEVRLSDGEAPTAAADGIVVEGRPAELDGTAWAAALGKLEGGTGASLEFLRADLTPGLLKLGDTGLRDAHVVVARDGDGFRATLDGPNARGALDWQRADGGRVHARLDRLALEAIRNPPPTPRALADAVERRDEPAAKPFDPVRAPTLDVDVEDFGMGGVGFGRLRVLTTRIDQGQQLDVFKLAGEGLDAELHGDWQRADSRSSANASFQVTSAKADQVLGVLGYAASIDAKRARVEGELAWPATPDGLALAEAKGHVTLDLEKGQLKAVNPGGTGRVLGLLNLYALPRRLLLDFRDVAGQGLAFDTLKGSFTLADGQATTDDLDIVNPSLKIELRGRIGLAARDFDQRVTVKPDLSTGVAVGATLLGGPIAGGIALVVQQLAGKPLSALTQYSYRVTGGWDDPQIEKGGETRPAKNALGDSRDDSKGNPK